MSPALARGVQAVEQCFKDVLCHALSDARAQLPRSIAGSQLYTVHADLVREASHAETVEAIMALEEAIFNCAKDAFREVGAHLNHAAPINQLPGEVFCQIFSNLHFTDNVAVSHTCNLWRTCALGDVTLWRDIWNNSGNKVPELLRRTKHAPVRLHLTDIKSLARDGEALEEISAHMEHIQSLKLWLGYQSDPDITNDILRLIRNPAPLLEYFQLVLSPIGYSTVLPPDIFSGSAPRLKRVWLNAVTVTSDGYPALAQVESLEYDGFNNILVSTLREVLRVFPAVTTMRVGVYAVHFNDDLPMPSERAWKLLTIDGNRETEPGNPSENMIEMLRWFNHAAALQLRMEWATMAVAAEIIQTLAPIRTLSITGSYPENSQCFEASDGGERRRLLDPLPFLSTESLILNSTLLRDVTDFELLEYLWPPTRAPRIFELPQLERLTIYLMADYEHGAWWLKECVGIFQLDDEDYCLCPQLQRLTIASQFPRPRRTVAAEDVLRFIQHQLRFDAARLLPELRLRNVEFLEPLTSIAAQKLAAAMQTAIQEEPQLLPPSSPWYRPMYNW